MKLYSLLACFIITLLSLKSYSQDTLVFQKRSNENKLFKLPLNDYEVKIKPHNGKRKRVIITDYKDSILTLKVWTYKLKGRKTKRGEIRDLYKDYPLADGMPDDTIQKRVAIIDSLREQIMYSEKVNLHINEVDKLIIYNGYNPRMMKVLKATEWASVGWLVIGIPLTAVFQSIPYFITWNAVGIGIATFSIITLNKKIKLEKWKINKKTTAINGCSVCPSGHSP